MCSSGTPIVRAARQSVAVSIGLLANRCFDKGGESFFFALSLLISLPVSPILSLSLGLSPSLARPGLYDWSSSSTLRLSKVRACVRACVFYSHVVTLC